MERSLAYGLVLLVACLRVNAALAAEVAPADQGISMPGVSGMAELDHGKDAVHLVCVHDYKDDAKNPGLQAAPRFGLITLSAKAEWKKGQPLLVYRAMPNPAWQDERASDLEGICAIPGANGEFLANESSYWKDDAGAEHYGRIFRVSVAATGDSWSVRILGTIPLPHYSGDVEGIACARTADGKLVLLLGERGGQAAYWPGFLHWGWLDLDQGTFTPPSAEQGQYDGWMGMYGPGFQEEHVPDTTYNPYGRAISDLYIDPMGQIWGSAAVDMGDSGPFRSYVTRLAQFNPAAAVPVESTGGLVLEWKVEGVKIEALCGPYTEGAVFSFATDDESFGGAWRPLGPCTGTTSYY